MKLYLLWIIIFHFGFVFSFGDEFKILFRRDVSNGLFSIVSKNLANKKNITPNTISPDSETDLSVLTNDEIKQEMEKLIETGNKLKNAEIVTKDLQELMVTDAGKTERTPSVNHKRKSNVCSPHPSWSIESTRIYSVYIPNECKGVKMSRNSTTSGSEIEDYQEYVYQENENAIDHFNACSDEQCNFKGKCLATETDEVFCICNDWSFGATCQINATGIAIGFLIAIFILGLAMTVLFIVKNCLKYKKWRKNSRKFEEKNHRENIEEKLELSKLEFK